VSTFSKGDKVFNIGVGLGSVMGSAYNTTIPPVSGSLEFGVADNILTKGVIGIAPFIGFGAYKYETYSGHENYTFIPVGVRGVFHYPLVEKLDTYGGLLFGYFVVSGTHIGTATDHSLSEEDTISLRNLQDWLNWELRLFLSISE